MYMIYNDNYRGSDLTTLSELRHWIWTQAFHDPYVP
eukprot:CAMPEP_0184686338 /NCGR_PEP_ID=MMETSP0312-20130426/22099_1 /TAXON_ID=31354 /ORGANISM="Compsopogon coeruleus, Strain SAG 36.94" /LENGTH=35 /DNA_ID= /DNA_START= /DNA_END= /DNA_ORIENTATION=